MTSAGLHSFERLCPVLRELPEFYVFPPDVLGEEGMKN